MKKGYLSEHFVAVASKRLSAVEVDAETSNQHEFNATKEVRKVLGTETHEKTTFPTKFIWFGNQNETFDAEGFLTLYDARLNHPTRTEFRLYFPSNEVMELAQPSDLMLLAKRTDGSVMLIVAVAGGTVENQLLWLFGLSAQTERFALQEVEADDRELDFPVRTILDELGIEPEEPETDHLDSILEKIGFKFPTTQAFGLLARGSITGLDPLSNPDDTLVAWMNQEDKLFRRLERHIISERLQSGFIGKHEVDVDGFIEFSLSVQNRRKARAGFAFENHLEEIFKAHQVQYVRTAITENKSKPDFLFPGLAQYKDLAFPTSALTMLGVKTSCKDRWRQITTEAHRIGIKHLLTLEPGISQNQTNEMANNHVRLVIPHSIHQTYRETQRDWLLTVQNFIDLVKERQAAVPSRKSLLGF